MRNELMTIFHSPIPPEQFMARIDELSKEADELKIYNSSLLEENSRLAKMFPFVGLNIEELQGIHGLIEGQIARTAKSQSYDTSYELVSDVQCLIDLVSLVSKPIER